jgi:PAS domain S-box-containing protein
MTRHPEKERLIELYACQILDSEDEQEFDELTRFVTMITKCPAASITFVDEDRQWFKSKWGIAEKETTPDRSFCHFTIQQDEPMIVEDASADERFAGYPDVMEGRIGFYAGVPVYSPDKGERIGAVCVMDTKKRTILPEQIAAMQLVSRQVTHLLGIRNRTRLLKEYEDDLLEKTEQALSAFFRDSAIPKWIYDVETLRIFQVNDKAVEIYGYTKEEFLSLSLVDIRESDEKKNIHQLVQTMGQGNNSVQFETVHQKKNGQTIPVEVTITNMLYQGRKARLASMHDISEKIKLQRLLEDDREKLQEKLAMAAHTAKEEARGHIGRELHDNINQILASTRLFLELASSNPHMTQEMIRMSKDNLTEAMNEIRSLSRALVTDREEFSLVRSVDDLVNSYRITHVFEVEVDFSGYIEDLPDDLKLTLFRIIQEALNNCARYSGAARVWLQIRCREDLKIVIRDNGIGFDTGLPRAGIGLRNMKNRAEFYNGSVAISSTPGLGTKVEVEIPLASQGIVF